LNRYIIDSGATKSITADYERLTNKRKYYGLVTYGDGQQLMAQYIGDINGLEDFIYVPGCNIDLLSADSLSKQTGCKVMFDGEKGYVSLVKNLNDKYVEIIIGERCEDGLYRTFADFNITDLRNKNSFILLAQEDISLRRTARQELLHNNLWRQLHIKLGHASITKIHSMREDRCVKHLFIPKNMPTDFYCEACALGKAQKTPKPKINNDENASEIELNSFDKIYSDVGGPLIKSLGGGYRFYVLFIDKKSRFKWIYFLHSKDEVKDKFQLFQNKIRLEFGRTIGILKSDRGGEYLDGEFSMYLNKCGIIHETSAPYSQWQNGVAERANRTIKDMARTMLIAAKLPAALWSYAMEYAVYLSNRLPSKSLPDKMSPYQILFNRQSDLKNIHTFGCDVYIRVDDSIRTDLEPKSTLRYYLGLSSQSSDIFHIFNPISKRIGLSRDGYKFDDNMISIRSRSEIKLDNIDFILPKPDVIKITPENITSSSNGPTNIPVNSVPVISNKEVIQNSDVTNNRPKRIITENVLFKDYVSAAIIEEDKSDEMISVDGNRSFTLAEVRQMPDWPEYEKAMNLEMDAIILNDTWEDVDQLPDGRKPVGYVWVFTRKVHETPIRYKARLCAQGFSQTHGFDYFETYSPVIRQTSIRVILSIAASENMHLHQMDVNTAFLNGDIDTEVYMKRPNELGGKSKYVKLKKALYGLKQASRIWNTNIDKFMKQLGFKQSIVEPCIYIHGKGNAKVIVGLYVDDLIIASKSMDGINFIKNALTIQYSMKDLGILNTIIGIKVTRDENGISLDQEKYIDSIVDRFNLNDSYNTYVPMTNSVKFSADMELLNEKVTNLSIEDVPYRQAVGALLYATQCTRPDIAFSVSKMSQFMNCYSAAHWQGVEQIIRYVKSTKNLRIRYTRDNEIKNKNVLVGYSDADWASDIDTRKSQSGYVFYLNGGPISWASNKQTTVALSSVESEYIALSSATQELVYLRQLLEDIGYQQSDPTIIYEDNQGAILLADNHGIYSKRTKHIDVRHHYLRDIIKSGWLQVRHIPTERQNADILTKALVASKFRADCAQLMSPLSSVKDLR